METHTHTQKKKAQPKEPVPKGRASNPKKLHLIDNYKNP